MRNPRSKHVDVWCPNSLTIFLKNCYIQFPFVQFRRWTKLEICFLIQNSWDVFYSSLLRSGPTFYIWSLESNVWHSFTIFVTFFLSKGKSQFFRVYNYSQKLSFLTVLEKKEAFWYWSKTLDPTTEKSMCPLPVSLFLETILSEGCCLNTKLGLYSVISR